MYRKIRSYATFSPDTHSDPKPLNNSDSSHCADTYLVLVEDVEEIRNAELLGSLLTPPHQRLFQEVSLVGCEFPAGRDRPQKTESTHARKKEREGSIDDGLGELGIDTPRSGTSRGGVSMAVSRAGAHPTCD